MISRLRKIQIRDLARETLQKYEGMSLPVRPQQIAEKLDIVVQSFEPPRPEVSGFLMQSGNMFGIGYSTAIKNEGFQNFTISHELGHYLIEGHPMAVLKNGIHYSLSGYISKDRFEEEADAFACEFLMPWKLIEPIVFRTEAGFAAIRNLGDQCRSSLVASAIRYVEITRETMAVVVSHRGTVEFMTASESFRQIPGIDWLRKRDILPKNVPSWSKCTAMGWIESGASAEEGSNLRNWFDGAPSAEVREDVTGLGSYQRLLTVLTTDFSPEEEGDVDAEDDDYIERWKEGRFRKR